MNDTWLEPPEWPVRFPLLGANEAHVWRVHLPSVGRELNHLRSLLAPEELARSLQFPHSARREQWQITRGLLRRLLAGYLGVPAAEISIRLGAHGKPALGHLAHAGFSFNLSHSGEFAVFAFTRAGDIGVDIECIVESRHGLDEIARRHFAPGELTALHALPIAERQRAFYTLWTRKEAFVKARGGGVFSGLDQFEVALNAPRVLAVSRTETGTVAADWWMAALPSSAECVGAVVTRTAHCHARFWQYPARPTD